MALAFVLGTISAFASVAQTHHPNGWDGYYYVMQMHSWLKFGHLQSQDFSLVYPYFILINSLFGDHVFAFKLGSSILGGALVAATFLLAKTRCQEHVVALLVPAYLIFSPTTTYFISQFPKNVLGLVFFILLLRSLIKGQYGLAALFFVFSLLSHRMTGGLGLVIVALYALRKLHWKWLLGGGALMALVSLLPGILHISDLERFSGQFAVIPQFAPYSMYKLFHNSIDIWWTIELLALSIGLIFSVFYYMRKTSHGNTSWFGRWGIPVLIMICLFPFFKIEFGSMGYRFFMVLPCIMAVYLVGNLKTSTMQAYFTSALMLIGAFFSYKSYNPQLHDPPNQKYELIVDRLSASFSPDQFPLVIVHKSLAEMLIFKTDFDALNWLPPAEMDPAKVLRIVSNVEYVHLTKHLDRKDIERIQRLTLKYFAMPEVIWRTFYNSIQEKKDKTLLERLENGGNPLQNRPYYLLKGKTNL